MNVAVVGIVGASLAGFLVGCGGASPQVVTGPPAQQEVVDIEEMHITARRGANGEYEFDATDAETLFDQATQLLNAEHCDRAVVLYDRLVREFAASTYVSPSLYNAGLCLDRMHQLEPAAQHFRDLIANVPTSEDVKHAHFMLSNLLIRLEGWEEALTVVEHLLAREDLSSEERVEALARKAQAQFGGGHVEEADRDARTCLAYFHTRTEDDPVRDDFFVAAANFVLAEVIRIRASEIVLPEADPDTQRAALERRARLLLNAQTEYFNTVRLGNPTWASASGYRIGQMYDEFWQLIVNAPTPPNHTLTGENLALFGREYHRRLREMVRPLLTHAIRYWELTLMMVERSGVHTEWDDHARADLERVRASLLAETPGAPTAPSSALPPPNAATTQAPHDAAPASAPSDADAGTPSTTPSAVNPSTTPAPANR